MDKVAHVPDTGYQRTEWARRGWPACGPSPPSQCRQHLPLAVNVNNVASTTLQGPVNQVCQAPGVPEAATTAQAPQGAMEEGPPPAPPPPLWAPSWASTWFLSHLALCLWLQPVAHAQLLAWLDLGAPEVEPENEASGKRGFATCAPETREWDGPGQTGETLRQREGTPIT